LAHITTIGGVMLKLYRNFFMAGVVSLGLAACGDDLTIVDPVTPPPPEVPNITTFSVSPTSATVAPGTFVQASATLITKPGVTGTVTWNSSNPAVATVDGTGRIDAVTEGTTVVTATATAGTQTATAAIGVTVRPIQAAQVSIKSITTGLTNLPVTAGNVAGQIEVTLNFDPGEQIVDSVNVFIGNKRAAKQSFVTSPAAGDIVLSINTANYTKNTTTGVATVDFLNGPTTISAAVYPRGSSATATNATPIVLNNMDGWAATMTSPTAFANSAAGLTYWGGPTAGGLTTATVYPVIYTPGRTVATVTFAAGGCAGFVDTSLPFTATFGYTAAGATAPNCGGAGGYEWVGGARDNVTVTAAIDNTNNPFPVTPLIANTIVLGSTPDSLRFDWRSPTVSVPSIARVAPAVTGWVNGTFNFINFASADAGVGLLAARNRTTTYSTATCSVSATNAAMPTGTGIDINGGVVCPSNSIGGAAGLGGTAAWRVRGHESDRLANAGQSSLSQAFNTDYTAPQQRWGIAGVATGGAYTASIATADSTFRASKPVAATNFWRAEFIDERSGFYNNGMPDGAGVAAQSHALNSAGHVRNLGACFMPMGNATTPAIASTFYTAPGCLAVGQEFVDVVANLISIDGVALTGRDGELRNDGWMGGVQLDIPAAEGYWGYASNVTDAAGNTSAGMQRGTLVNFQSPFASLIGSMINNQISATSFGFSATFADSAEVVAQSSMVAYPNFDAIPGAGVTTDSARYTRTQVGTAFDNVITSPFTGALSPATGAPYVRHLEVVTAAAWDGLADPAPSNIDPAPTTTKPTDVVAWSWNHGTTLSGHTTGPGRTAITSIPALLVQDGVNYATFNTGNTTNPVNHFRIIPTLATTDQFGSTTPLRAQAVSTTNNPNAPFVRVDFYRYNAATLSWWYLGSSTTAVLRDQGTNRSWVYSLPTASFVAAWDGSTQGAIAIGNQVAAVGVTAAGDGIAAGITF
jgi:hypothetical protein